MIEDAGWEFPLIGILVDLNQEQLDIAVSKFNAGTVAKADVLKAEAELADAQISYIEAKNRYNLSVKLLNDALYIPLNSKVELSKDFSQIHWDITLEECLSLAEENRLEIEILEKKENRIFHLLK